MAALLGGLATHGHDTRHQRRTPVFGTDGKAALDRPIKGQIHSAFLLAHPGTSWGILALI